jgi:GntR family histidine utilization transcriptional repressor
MTTHHDRILAEIRGHILAGRWTHGHRLPFETDMAAAYGVSRMTINKVLSQLTREGFLERRRKLGTVVAMPRVQSAVMEITDIEREIRDLGLAYGFRLIALRRGLPLPDERAQMRDDGPEAEVLRCTAVHDAGGTPFCLEERLINLAAAPTAADQDFRLQSPGRWLFQNVPWSSAEHRVRAISAGSAAARLLAVKPGTPCLEVVRRTESGPRCVTLARLTYPGDRHQVVAQFQPRQRALGD